MAEDERPVLIGSCGSSGSTLLSVMLDAHPDVMSGPELALFAHPFFWTLEGRAWRERLLHAIRLGSNARLHPDWTIANGFCPYAGLVLENTLSWYGSSLEGLSGLAARADSGPQLARALMEPLLQRRGKRVWAEKSPQNVYAFKAFLDRYPEGRVIYLIRDGRDVVASLLRKRWGTFKQSVAFWLVDTGICSLFTGHPRVMGVRYEALVAEPRETVAAVLDFLKLTPEVDQVMNYVQHSSRATTPDASSVGNPAWHSTPQQPITAAAVGTWRRELSAEQVSALSASRIVQPVDGYPELEGQTFTGLLAGARYEGMESVPTDCRILLELLSHEGLFLSGTDCVGSGTFHERFVECDADRLPKADWNWQDKRQGAKFANLRRAVTAIEADHAALSRAHQELQSAHNALLAVPAIWAAYRCHQLPLREWPRALVSKVRRLLSGDDWQQRNDNIV
jgi:hypothetical protein